MNKARGQLRSFVNAGLTSWQTQDVEEGGDNLLWGKLALSDWQALEQELEEPARTQVEKLLASLTVLPQQVPNVQDAMLDMEGVRCQRAGEVLVFYRYNSSFDLVDIIRLTKAKAEWADLI